MDHARFYSYIPHMINWYDKNMYYISPNVIDILKEQNNKDKETIWTYLMDMQKEIASGIYDNNPKAKKAAQLEVDKHFEAHFLLPDRAK